ncbi:MAG: hypothetical protein OYG31_02570 [Candidatus Kaiserbacteria bacterium]|nr:hypothetical protein [Candidatus Kaiserbacteria bacterium]
MTEVPRSRKTKSIILLVTGAVAVGGISSFVSQDTDHDSAEPTKEVFRDGIDQDADTKRMFENIKRFIDDFCQKEVAKHGEEVFDASWCIEQFHGDLKRSITVQCIKENNLSYEACNRMAEVIIEFFQEL